MRTTVKLTLAIALLGAATAANAAYWSRTNYGKYSEYSGTRMGAWSYTNIVTWNDYVYYGKTFACPYGVAGCSQSYSESAWFAWTWGVSLSTQYSFIPNVWNATLGGQYSQTRTRTDTNTYTVNLKPGQKTQYAQYVPRRYGNVTVYGARIATGRTQQVCPTMGPLGTCWSGWKTEWEYNDNYSFKAAVINGWKNTWDPIQTFRLL